MSRQNPAFSRDLLVGVVLHSISWMISLVRSYQVCTHMPWGCKVGCSGRAGTGMASRVSILGALLDSSSPAGQHDCQGGTLRTTERASKYLHQGLLLQVFKEKDCSLAWYMGKLPQNVQPANVSHSTQVPCAIICTVMLHISEPAGCASATSLDFHLQPMALLEWLLLARQTCRTLPILCRPFQVWPPALCTASIKAKLTYLCRLIIFYLCRWQS